MMNTYFPSGNLEFGYVLGRECLCDQPPIKALCHESLMSFRGWQHFAHVVRSHSCGELSVSCVTPLEVCAGFPQILPHVPLLTVGTYAMINHSLEYNHLLSPVSLREFLNLRVV